MRTLNPPLRPIGSYFGILNQPDQALTRQKLLNVEGIYVGYQSTDILRGINIHAEPGEIVCVLGPNGAGKSTLFKALYGIIEIRRGWVSFDGVDVTQASPKDMLVAGVSLIPQTHGNFNEMTVRENLEMGMFIEKDHKRIQQRVHEILSLFPQLAVRSNQRAGTLSGGEQRMLEIGRALMTEPKLLLMDEPTTGLAPIVQKAIIREIKRLNDALGVTILLIQNTLHGLRMSNRGYILQFGRITYSGTGQELFESQELRRVFLGNRGINQNIE